MHSLALRACKEDGAAGCHAHKTWAWHPVRERRNIKTLASSWWGRRGGAGPYRLGSVRLVGRGDEVGDDRAVVFADAARVEDDVVVGVQSRGDLGHRAIVVAGGDLGG